jgi:choline dehydrogenase-like flavoprotein
LLDYLVVGAGSAGCALAGRLHEAGADVLLLEAGGKDSKREIAVPAAFSKLFRSEVDWNYDTEPEPGLAGRPIYWPRGKVLGGSSSLNAMMAIPGHRDDYDTWDGWSWDDVAPYYDRVWERLGVEELRDPNPLTLAFVDAAREAGIAASSLRPDDLEGVRVTPVTQRRGRRWSAADAYARDVPTRLNTHVARVVFEGRRAVGIELVDGEVLRAREIVVAGGAVNSPQLLLLSGIGAAAELARHGIPVVHELPDVGLHLQDHLAAGILVETSSPVTLFAAEKPLQVLRWLLFRRGLLTSNVAEAAAFVRSRPELHAPDLELLFAPVLFEEEGLAPPRSHGFTVAAVALQPLSTGVVRLRSADPLAAPVIEPRYLSHPADLEALVHGVELARRIVSLPPLAEHAGVELEPGDEDVESSIRAKAHTLYHPVGTCSLGRVVDRELRVRGVEGLRVVDASVVPRGHTHLPTLMIAERAADLLLAGARGRGDRALVDASV